MGEFAKRMAAEREVENLKHDIERHLMICSEQAMRISDLEAALRSWRDNYENTKPAVGGCGFVAVPLHQIDSLLK